MGAREIKFRAWDNYRKKMFVVSKIDWTFGEAICIYCEDVGTINSPDLMQFTGLSYSKGVEVYEGDYLKCTLGNYSGLCEWVWNEGRFVIRHLDKSAYHGEAIEVANCNITRMSSATSTKIKI